MKAYHALLLISLFCFVTNSAWTQKTAITQEGKVVILYENGTWKYLEVTNKQKQQHTNSKAIEKEVEESVTALPPQASIILSENKNSETKELLHEESPILSKYFKSQNEILCKAYIKTATGKASLHTEWKVNTNEGFRYYGFISPEIPLEIILEDGKKIQLTVTEKVYPKEENRLPISTYRAEFPISEQQLFQLYSTKALQIKMTWKKRKEEVYKTSSPLIFRELIAQILSDK